MKHLAVLSFLILVLLGACATDQEVKPLVDSVSPDELQPAESWWQPETRLIWQWQLDSADVDASLAIQVIDLDYETDPAVIAALKEKGIRTICYISVGSWENWRPDADQFPAELLGKRYRGWQGERWLDIRQLDSLAPLLRARLDHCQKSGFDAVEPDNMDITSNASGFPITYADQLTFAQWLAQEAHVRGLAIGQKNAPEMTADLVDVFDFAISEDCFAQGWCEELLPYINAGKAVFAAEYSDTDVDFTAACSWATQTDFSFILKNRDLDTWIQNCEDALK
jgi:hypothetical protein